MLYQMTQLFGDGVDQAALDELVLELIRALETILHDAESLPVAPGAPTCDGDHREIEQLLEAVTDLGGNGYAFFSDRNGARKIRRPVGLLA